MDVYTNGVDNNFSYNTSVDLKQKHWYFKNQVGANVAACNTNEEQTTFGGHIANEELYYSRYPNLKTITGSSLAGSIFGNSLYKAASGWLLPSALLHAEGGGGAVRPCHGRVVSGAETMGARALRRCLHGPDAGRRRFCGRRRGWLHMARYGAAKGAWHPERP